MASRIEEKFSRIGGDGDHRAGFDAAAVGRGGGIPQPGHAEDGLRLSGWSRAAWPAGGIGKVAAACPSVSSVTRNAF